MRKSKRQVSGFLALFIVLFFCFTVSSVNAEEKDKDMEAFRSRIVFLQNAGDTSQAVTVANQYVVFVERKYGYLHKNTAIAFHALGQAYFTDGRYGPAAEAYKKALRVEERIVGPNHPDLVPHLEALATVYYALVKFEEASKLTERANRLAQH